ncbi:hypothetical protein Plim_3537 [Planctopirus limnophila DSM 3776]|uniref:Uncharacterized protein n=1 Tax=Planctopirus limnophila (strain ATCC 43296 / DSM 3776 / IFAM 1008 / Mu 290) TaxID=521674 RepID=D5SV64_PLAL2|nr:hypothetical protein Plim_3537 [Planctopirus limnophila DSM 3776]
MMDVPRRFEKSLGAAFLLEDATSGKLMSKSLVLWKNETTNNLWLTSDMDSSGSFIIVTSKCYDTSRGCFVWIQDESFIGKAPTDSNNQLQSLV